MEEVGLDFSTLRTQGPDMKRLSIVKFRASLHGVTNLDQGRRLWALNKRIREKGRG